MWPTRCENLRSPGEHCTTSTDIVYSIFVMNEETNLSFSHRLFIVSSFRVEGIGKWRRGRNLYLSTRFHWCGHSTFKAFQRKPFVLKSIIFKYLLSMSFRKWFHIHSYCMRFFFDSRIQFWFDTQKSLTQFNCECNLDSYRSHHFPFPYIVWLEFK